MPAVLESATNIQLGAVEFIERFLSFQGEPLRLFPFQKTFCNSVNLLKDRSTIKKARQVGMTLCVSALLCYYLCCHKSVGFFVLSKTKDQVGICYTYIREFLSSSPILRKLIDWKRSKLTDLILKNGNRVLVRSAGQVHGATVRGFSVGMLAKNGGVVYDEASYIPDNAFKATIFSASGGHSITMLSTPALPRGEFYNACNSKLFKHFHFPAHVSPRITAEDIELARELKSASIVNTEILAEFSSGDAAVFDAADIDAATDDKLPKFPGPYHAEDDAVYHASDDVSKIGRDRYFLTIGKLDKSGCQVVGYDSWAGTMHGDDLPECHLTDNPQEIIDAIMAYHQTFHFSKVYVDTSSDPFFAWTLQHKYLLNVAEVTWSTSLKHKLISHLQSCLKARKIKIPASDQIRKELLCFAYEWNLEKDNSEVMLYLGGGEDDALASLAMLAQSISVKREYKFKDILICR